MRKYNIHEAKTHLSRLVEEATQGESFMIAKSGRPMVKVVALDTPTDKKKSRIGFMKGEIKLPEGFNHMGSKEIAHLFGTEE